MVGAVGGTPSGTWLTPEQFEADAACKAEVEKALAAYKPDEEKAKFDKAMEAYEKELTAYKTAAAADPASTKPAATANAPSSSPRASPNPQASPAKCRRRKARLSLRTLRQTLHPLRHSRRTLGPGESGTQIRDVDQYTLMGALIHGWRNTWGQGDFPFLYIQKPSGGGPALNPADPITLAANKFATEPPTPPTDGAYRDLHIRIGRYPHTYMVISSDLGPDTHPWNKTGYGARGARIIGAVYGHKSSTTAPSMTRSKSTAPKSTSNSPTSARASSPATAKSFGLRRRRRRQKFHWADAAIDGDTVILHSEKVANPVAVRYAWSSSTPWANLFNKDGLPTQTFRTDDW